MRTKLLREGCFALLLMAASTHATVKETVNIGKVECGKVQYQCEMVVTYKADCSEVSKVTPKCRPKKSKCKGVSVSMVTENGCTVTGKYKNTGKRQSVSRLAIDGFGETTPETTTTATATTMPLAMPLHETVNIGKVKCGKVKYQCTMLVTYMDDCSTVNLKVKPKCSPKKSKCKKGGVYVAIVTANGCIVTGKYMNNGKRQSMGELTTHGFVGFASRCSVLHGLLCNILS